MKRKLMDFALASYIAFAICDTAFATQLMVTSASDSGEGSLRAALSNASDGDEIVFSLAEGDNIIALSSTLEIAASRFPTGISIVGSNGGRGVVLDGGSSVGIMSIKTGNVVKLRSLTFRNGSAANGGGICSYGRLIAENCAFYSNKASASGGGVGVFGTNDGVVALVLVRCTFSENSANSSGGGVCFARPARICMCSFISNVGGSGGGISSSCDDHLIASCNIVNNKGGEGAGLSMYTGSWTGYDRICWNVLAFCNIKGSPTYASDDISQYYNVDGGTVLCQTFNHQVRPLALHM